MEKAEYINRKRSLFPTKYILNDTDYAKGWNAAVQCISQLPTEDVAPIKRGKWLWRQSDEKMSCSECGEDDFTDEELYNPNFFYSKYKYCPACGAKMEGGTR